MSDGRDDQPEESEGSYAIAESTASNEPADQTSARQDQSEVSEESSPQPWPVAIHPEVTETGRLILESERMVVIAIYTDDNQPDDSEIHPRALINPDEYGRTGIIGRVQLEPELENPPGSPAHDNPEPPVAESIERYEPAQERHEPADQTRDLQDRSEACGDGIRPQPAVINPTVMTETGYVMVEMSPRRVTVTEDNATDDDRRPDDSTEVVSIPEHGTAGIVERIQEGTEDISIEPLPIKTTTDCNEPSAAVLREEVPALLDFTDHGREIEPVQESTDHNEPVQESPSTPVYVISCSNCTETESLAESTEGNERPVLPHESALESEPAILNDPVLRDVLVYVPGQGRYNATEMQESPVGQGTEYVINETGELQESNTEIEPIADTDQILPDVLVYSPGQGRYSTEMQEPAVREGTECTNDQPVEVQGSNTEIEPVPEDRSEANVLISIPHTTEIELASESSDQSDVDLPIEEYWISPLEDIAEEDEFSPDSEEELYSNFCACWRLILQARGPCINKSTGLYTAVCPLWLQDACDIIWYRCCRLILAWPSEAGSRICDLWMRTAKSLFPWMRRRVSPDTAAMTEAEGAALQRMLALAAAELNLQADFLGNEDGSGG